MCRFIAYKGQRLTLADLVIHPEHSLLAQSIGAKQGNTIQNADGFGIGWYSDSGGSEPCVFTDTLPASSSRNLQRLSRHISSSVIFAHVRAASPGLAVSDVNCHPFQIGRYMWMHNGSVPDFVKIRRKLREALPDSLYNSIQGTTDSEHAFALFLSFLGSTETQRTPSELMAAMRKTIAHLQLLTSAAGITRACRYNFALTDGQSMLITRYVTPETEIAATLYYAQGSRFLYDGSRCQMLQEENGRKSIIVASEALTPSTCHWEPVAQNTALLIDEEFNIEICNL